MPDDNEREKTPARSLGPIEPTVPRRFQAACRKRRSASRMSSARAGGAGSKSSEEVMEILEAFDLTLTLRGAAELAGCDHKTVANWVRARDEAGGGLPVSVRPRGRLCCAAVQRTSPR